eukprot:TRINITY_DN25145_c0_g1_i2.p1 TRINITY_DN25145_c0_g1~~TRINITY_DN25145_c0_g1_i2.p1  ORF type:complete len:793 (+),score=108.08 TRINITY_DN25145_c0_g1_i2:233-2380(+)
MGRSATDALLGVPADFLDNVDSCCVCSQYFDNVEFESYHTRIQRLESAMSWRLRWYGCMEPPALDSDVFMERKTHHVEWVAASSVKERFKLPCRTVQPFLDGSAALDLSDKQKRLANEIQAQLQDKKMKPTLRTSCRRVAFQSVTSNAIRISFDTDISFLNERRGCQEQKGDLQWCSNADAKGELSHSFCNYGILEVKIKSGSELPPWVKELEHSGAIISMPNLSKFGHGIWSIYHQSGALNIKPYWFDAVTNDSSQSSPDNAKRDDVPAPADDPAHDERKHVGFRWWPSTIARSNVIKIPDKAANGTSGGGGIMIAERKRKLEPQAKTFFANERTLLQWISPVTLVLSISIAMMSMGATMGEAAQTTIIPLGVTMMCVSIFWLLYAFRIYFKRLKKIRERDDTGFDEVVGPSAMVFSLLCMCVLALIVIVVNPFASSPVEVHLGHACTSPLASFADFPILGAQPSGVIYHPARKSIFIASPHHLMEMASDGTIVDHPFPGFDIEAVTLDPLRPDTIYLGLETPNRIVAVDVDSMTASTPVIVDSVMGASHQLEALAVCPTELCGNEGKRFIVGGSSDSLRVLDLGSYPVKFPYAGAKLVDEIDIDALLCSRMGRCVNKTGRVTDLHVTAGALYILADRESELIKIPWSSTAKSKFAGAAELPTILRLPEETKGGWQGFCTKKGSEGNEFALLANDFHGFLKEAEISQDGFAALC